MTGAGVGTQIGEANDLAVASFWFGEGLGPLEELSMKSFIASGASFQLYSYENRSVPKGVELKNAEEIFPKSEVFANRGNSRSYSTFADLFRYRLVERTRATWVDLDIVKSAKAFPQSDFLLGYEDFGVVNTAVLRYDKNSAFGQLVSENISRADPRNASHVELSPKLFTKAVNELRLESRVQEQEVFYPVHYLDIWRLYSPKHCDWSRRRFQMSSTVHLWNSILTRVEPDFKDLRPPAGSYMAWLYDQFGIVPKSEKVCDWQALRLSLVPSRMEKLWRLSLSLRAVSKKLPRTRV